MKGANACTRILLIECRRPGSVLSWILINLQEPGRRPCSSFSYTAITSETEAIVGLGTFWRRSRVYPKEVLYSLPLTRPGYQNGRERSTGDHYYKEGDAYRPNIVESVAKAVMKSADHYKASKVAVIGHSGGGTILAAGLVVYPDFAPNLAVFYRQQF